MKISVIGIPTFQMLLSRAMIDALMEFSKSHYDGKCKDIGRVGGFLYGWHNMVDGQESTMVMVRATWREADLTLKLCESPASRETPEMIAMVTDYTMNLRWAMNVSRETHWEIVIKDK